MRAALQFKNLVHGRLATKSIEFWIKKIIVCGHREAPRLEILGVVWVVARRHATVSFGRREAPRDRGILSPPTNSAKFGQIRRNFN